MSKEIESISAALFDKIRSRFTNITLGNESAKSESDPEKARFFNFTYIDKDGAEFGTVTISLIDETSLKVYYGQNISGNMDKEQRKEWYEFLRNLRQFAKRNLLTFDTRDINKSNLDIKDIKQQAKTDDKFTTQDIAMTESRLYGTSRNSYADMGECRVLIKHDGLVSDEKRGDRARRIKEIFIETPRGERLLCPHTNLDGARALARHISAGGVMHDELAEHINGLVAEMSSMKHFVRGTKHRQFEDQETADMTRAAVHRYDQIRRTLRHMRSERGYHNYFETFSPAENPLEDIDVAALKERFVKKIYDDRFEAALPYVYRAYKQQAESLGNYGTDLEEWADEVTESIWATPDNDDKVQALQQLLSSPLMGGIGGIDAITKLKPIIGDDELNDQIADYADPVRGQGPDADVSVIVKTWLTQHAPELINQIDFGPNNGNNDKTNFVGQVSPKVAHPDDQYGATTMDEPVVNESDDGLDFIRSLAGLKR